ncbi:DNA-binding response regulator, partial [Enterococcus hirae]
VAEGLRQLLEPEYNLIGIVENGRELLREAEKTQPDLILVDVSMPELNGIEAVRALRKRQHSARILFLTMHSDTAYAAEALAAGASGY